MKLNRAVVLKSAYLIIEQEMMLHTAKISYPLIIEKGRAW